MRSLSARNQAWRLLRIYVLLLGAGLLVEGIFDFVLGVIATTSIPSFLSWIHPDLRHDVIHIVWGAAILLLPVARPRIFRPEILATSFGVFYLALGLVGVFDHRPLGIRLDLPENVFHFTVGSVALAFGLFGLLNPQSSELEMTTQAAD